MSRWKFLANRRNLSHLFVCFFILFHGFVCKRISLQQTVDANVNFNAREGRSTVEVCNCCDIFLSKKSYAASSLPLLQVCDGRGKALPSGKQACTKFQRICTDGNHSIVLCKPVTGRTHQVSNPVLVFMIAYGSSYIHTSGNILVIILN